MDLMSLEQCLALGVCAISSVILMLNCAKELKSKKKSIRAKSSLVQSKPEKPKEKEKEPVLENSSNPTTSSNPTDNKKSKEHEKEKEKEGVSNTQKTEGEAKPKKGTSGEKEGNKKSKAEKKKKDKKETTKGSDDDGEYVENTLNDSQSQIEVKYSNGNIVYMKEGKIVKVEPDSKKA